jgi:DNA-binding PadR family transcriptional regulator
MSPVRLTRPSALVLVALSRGVRHGFDVLDATGLPSGTVYPILRRFETAGLVKSRWEAVQIARDEGRPPRRYYELTGAGAEALREALARHPDARAALAPAGVPAHARLGPMRPA